MENRFFNEALHNFTSDYAYGSRIKSLYDKGYSTQAIKDRLDYPVSYEAVLEYLKDHLIKTKKIVFDRNDIPSCSQGATYETEYDAYGRKTFRLKNPGSHRDIKYETIGFSGNIREIPDLYECYAHFVKAPVLCVQTSPGDTSEARKDPESVFSVDIFDLLNTKQAEYLSGLPLPRKPFYILINEPLADILDIFHKNEVWHGEIVSPKAGKIYIL